MSVAKAVLKVFLPVFLGLLLFVVPQPAGASSVLLGSGSQTNHLLILFGPGQTLQYELRHDGTILTGAQLLAAVIQATGGYSLTTAPRENNGETISLSSQLALWNGQGLFAHFHQFAFGVFINGFASGNFGAASDGSYDSFFSYQIGGASADFTAAPIGATDRMLADGDRDAYVFTGAFSSPGLAAWMVTHAITDLQADSDGDGMTNLFEYALRRHPWIADALPAVQSGRTESNGETFLTLTYRRPHDEWAATPEGADAEYDGVRYTVETSTDLVYWISGANYVIQTVTPDATGPMATVIARVPADSPRKFLRLRVHLP